MLRLRLVAGRGAISACSSRTSQSAAAAVAMTAVTVPCLGQAASRALCSLVRPAWRAPRPRAAWSSARRTGSCQRWRIQSLDPIHCCETYVVRAWDWQSCAWDLHAFARRRCTRTVPGTALVEKQYGTCTVPATCTAPLWRLSYLPCTSTDEPALKCAISSRLVYKVSRSRLLFPDALALSLCKLATGRRVVDVVSLGAFDASLRHSDYNRRAHTRPSTTRCSRGKPGHAAAATRRVVVRERMARLPVSELLELGLAEAEEGGALTPPADRVALLHDGGRHRRGYVP